MFNFMKELQANLQSVELEQTAPKETTSKAKAEGTSRPRIEKNPTNGADIRILASGAVYPSQAFVEEFNLEYAHRDAENPGNALDFFNSKAWVQYKNGPQLLLAYTLPKTEAKVEMFGTSRFDKETGEPINSVLEQGSPLSEESLNAIAVALGHQYPEDEENTSPWANLLAAQGVDDTPARYIDLYLVRSLEGDVLTMKDGIYLIPKVVERGAKKGEATYIRRDKIQVLPLVLFNEEVKAQLEANKETSGQVDGVIQEVSDETAPEVTTQLQENQVVDTIDGEEVSSEELVPQTEVQA